MPPAGIKGRKIPSSITGSSPISELLPRLVRAWLRAPRMTTRAALRFCSQVGARNLRSLPFKYLCASLGTPPVSGAILDGEIVVLDAKGVSQFNANR